ncbi:MSHA biogenesis protein MshO [Vibrio galatheae]|uniref:MSHA biogenesis protein MshO n=1 Tax=Vibrio galatheae TaxID=579748 RepID=A0A0F4NG45_9VIBR|nr:MSHA biogenesis protein MshO [Vibrio galatheae]
MRGFTLIEMVASIVLLGVVGLFLGEVIRQSLVLFSDTSSREALVQQGRFVTERLRRELREAVPNSVVVNGDGSCIEFVPIVNSGLYQQLPVVGSSDTLRVLPITKQITANDRLTIYPTSNSELRATPTGSGQVTVIENDVTFTTPVPPATWSMVDIDLTPPTVFTNGSPANRFYIYNQLVAFCKFGSTLNRYSGYPLGRLDLDPVYLGAPTKMVENLSGANFVVEQPQLQRNGLIKMELIFEAKGEQVRFDHDALIYNTP